MLHSLESLIKRQVCKNALSQVLELTQFCMGLFLNGSINQRTDRDFSAATAVLRVQRNALHINVSLDQSEL